MMAGVIGSLRASVQGQGRLRLLGPMQSPLGLCRGPRVRRRGRAALGLEIKALSGSRSGSAF